MVWNNGDGSDLMEGGHDYDIAVVNGSDSDGDEFVIAPNGARVAFDRVNLVPFSLDIGTTEKLVVNGQGGDDTITGCAGLADLIKLRLDGGEGDDSITGGDGDDALYGGAATTCWSASAAATRCSAAGATTGWSGTTATAPT